MTYYVEICRPDIYTFLYTINVVLVADLYLFVCYNNSGWKTSHARVDTAFYMGQNTSNSPDILQELKITP